MKTRSRMERRRERGRAGSGGREQEVVKEETEASKQEAAYGREQGSCRDGLTTRGRFVVGQRTAQEAVVRQERPTKRL